MMNKKPSRVGAEFADEYLGHEGPIAINVEDARYRYYQWLRKWFGFKQKEVTNKCPFYQSMVAGSLIILASIVPIIIMKIIDIFILWPLSWVAPDFVDEFNERTSRSKMVFSWAVTLALLTIASIVGALLSSPILAWIGLVVHWIYSVPWIALVLTWLLIVFLVTDGIPWLFYGIGFIFEALFAFIIALINVPWLSVLMWFMVGLGALVGTAITMVLLYKLGVWFFKSTFTTWVIKKSCDIREFRIRRRKKHKIKVHKRKEKKIRMRELKEVEKGWEWKEPNEKWNEILMDAFSLIWAGLKIFPGYPFKWFGHVFMWVIGIIVYIALGLGWFGKRIWDIIVVVWSLVTETISNHCPPIDFVVGISEKGELIPRPSGNFRFKSMDLDNDILIKLSDLPDGFKPSIAKGGRRVTIRCTVRSSELEAAKRNRWKYGSDAVLMDVDVYKIQNLLYIPYRTTKKK